MGIVKNINYFLLLLLVSTVAGNVLAEESTVTDPANDGGSLTRSIESLKAIDTEQSFDTSLEDKDAKDSQCQRFPDNDKWVDRLRAGTHSRLCYGASWLDGLFGDEERFQGENFSGKISLGFKQDENDGFDPRLRVRIRAKLPNVSSRLDAFVGRVEDDSFISNTENDQDRFTNVGIRNVEDQDSEWLVGLGYRRPHKESNGFDYSIGAKLSSGFSPYAKVAHRHLFQSRADRYTKTTNTFFWRKEEGFGASSNIEHTKFIGKKNITVLNGTLKYTEEREQLEWFSDATWHHSLSDRRGISSSVYVRGEQESPASIPEFGTTFTYIQPVLREWLYMELGLDFRWERDQADTQFKSATRLGIQFEMLLGDYYRRKRHN